MMQDCAGTFFVKPTLPGDFRSPKQGQPRVACHFSECDGAGIC